MTEAEKLAKPAWDAVHLAAFPADDPGGCDGCEEGWCQSAVDAICEGRNQYHAAILPVIERLIAENGKLKAELKLITDYPPGA